MTTHVPRHEIPADRVRSVPSLIEDTQRSIDRLERQPRAFGMALDTALANAIAHCAHDPRASKLDTWDAWVAAMQVGSALFASATSAEPTVECLIAGKTRTIPELRPNPHAKAGHWLDAFWLAAMCRQHDRLAELCDVPLSVLRDSGAVYDEYIYAWVDTLQTYWKRGPGLGDKLVAAIEGTNPDTLQVAGRELVLEIMYPPMNLLYRLIRGDGERFNTELARSLELHNHYWTATEQRAADSNGLVALAPLALASIAHDGGVAVDVDSAYLPKHLLEGGRVGEAPI